MFAFGKNTLEIDVCGKAYTVDPFDKRLIEGVGNFRAKLKDLDVVDDPGPEAITSMCADAADLIECILGEGAYVGIFEGRTPNFIDHYELAIHLIASVMAFRARRITEFTQSGIKTSKDIMLANIQPQEPE